MPVREAWLSVAAHARGPWRWVRHSVRRWGPRAWIVLGVLAAIGLVALLWLVTHRYVRPEDPGERTAALQVVAQIAGGIVLLAGLAVTTWNVTIGRQGQITERFGRAIDQLGSDKLDVRLGGIYSLERIARDSRRDYQPIVEVLTAYVRTRAPLPEARMAAWRSENPIRALHELPPTEAQHDPAVDVQAALTVLSRRRALAGGGSLDLHGCDLANVVMGKADLRKAALWHADLSHALFFDADLSGAVLGSSCLDHTAFTGANLEKAHFEDVWGWSVVFAGADLSTANCYGAKMEHASFTEATMTGTRLPSAVLNRASFREARLQDAVLNGASCKGADFTGADLTRTDLVGADLTDAKGLTQEQLASAITDASTILPSYLSSPELT